MALNLAARFLNSCNRSAWLVVWATAETAISKAKERKGNDLSFMQGSTYREAWKGSNVKSVVCWFARADSRAQPERSGDGSSPQLLLLLLSAWGRAVDEPSPPT